MRISDWSSDVCSSDLLGRALDRNGVRPDAAHRASAPGLHRRRRAQRQRPRQALIVTAAEKPSFQEGFSLAGLQLSGNHATDTARHRSSASDQIGRAHVELQSLMRISYAVFCLKKKK